jgi:penicillin-binding protein 1A
MILFRLLFRLMVWVLVIGGGISIVLGCFAGLYFYNRLNRDLPKIEKLSDYKPKAVTQILGDDGTLLAEVWDERRYPVSLIEIPPHVINAFLAAEDSSFYAHGGIDFISILRATWVNLTSRVTKQGASTITQQIVKQLLLSREKTYERKLKEALLSYRLEKYLSKDEILSMYLNQIFLGSGAYGIKAAAKVHFHKELDELSIAQAALLGSLPKKPSELTRSQNFQMALDRQKYVLKQMLAKEFITKDQHEEAVKESVFFYPQEEENLFASPYFATHAIKIAEETIQKVNPDYTLRDPGGFIVRTSVDVKADALADKAMKNGLKAVDKRQGWRGVLGNIQGKNDRSLKWDDMKTGEELDSDRVYKALVIHSNQSSGLIKIRMGEIEGSLNVSDAKWAKTFSTLEVGSPEIKTSFGQPSKVIKTGDVIEVSVSKKELQEDGRFSYQFQLDQTPAVQGAMVVLHSATGEVKSIIGGYDYKESKFNRATQADLQPGSSFKPLIYLSALEELQLTPSTLVPDEPISYQTLDGIWAPQNFDKKFLGPITLRVALQKSRNVVSVFLLERIGVDKVIGSARRLGITSPIPRNMSIALGTPEVRVIDMVRSYAPFSSGGYLPDLLMVKSITERDGSEIYSGQPKQKQVIDSPQAFIMAHMMKGVIERGTAQVIRKLGVPVGGKTGTTNDHMDAWFIGYTPEWVSGVWVGFDVKRSLGKTETGGRAAAPIFLEFMTGFLKDTPTMDFTPPDGVVPVAVDVNSGLPVDGSSDGAFIEYFAVSGNDGNDNYANRYRELYVPRSQEGGDYLINSDF